MSALKNPTNDYSLCVIRYSLLKRPSRLRLNRHAKSAAVVIK